MSYTKQFGSSLLADYFLNLEEFNKMTGWLLKAVSDRQEDTFFLWFEKMAQCDKRSLVRFLIAKKVPLPKSYRNAILYRLKSCRSIGKIKALPTWEGEGKTS